MDGGGGVHGHGSHSGGGERRRKSSLTNGLLKANSYSYIFQIYYLREVFWLNCGEYTGLVIPCHRHSDRKLGQFLCLEPCPLTKCT